MNKIKIELEFDESVFRIMNQKKNRYMNKEKMWKLTWEEFIMIKTLS